MIRSIPSEGVPFPRYMERALYDPRHGYYARGDSPLGRSGDFYTSVSVGPLFGQLLARRFLRWHAENGIRGRWRLLEIGAHDGALAADILAAAATLDPAAYDTLGYTIAEPLATLRTRQRETLGAHAEHIRWVADANELAGDTLPGIAFGNELLDALPFHVVVRRSGRWHEEGVAPDPVDPGTLAWRDLGPVSGGPLAAALSRIDATHLPDGYRTEVRTGYAALHRAIARVINPGMAVWIDYGFARPEYYDPARREGTLRTFSGHRAGADPLAAPGLADITAHVDFTAVAEDAAEAGFAFAAFQNQGAWLTREARGWLAEMESTPDPAAIRRFRTLTHPAHLGARFHVFELARPGPATATPADFHRCGLT